MLSQLQNDFQVAANPAQAAILARFFKTGSGQYGAGDVFLGLKVPQTRKIAAKYKNLELTELKKLLQSEIHEQRLAAWLILVKQFEASESPERRQEIVDFYLANLERANNWDLVDLSAPKILGAHLLDKSTKERAILYQLAKSSNLWRQRVAIVATYTLIKNGQLRDTLDLALLLLEHPHDLIHKAIGWMLRELGKQNQALLEQFLRNNYQKIPRTTLRYAIERFDEKKRQAFLRGFIPGKVIKGSGYGQSQAFATINLEPALWPAAKARGVYAAWVFVGEQKYKGALFFGPRVVIDEETDVLEIHLLDYSGDLYGQTVSFSIEDFIREVRPFNSFAELKKQIAADISAVRQCLAD